MRFFDIQLNEREAPLTCIVDSNFNIECITFYCESLAQDIDVTEESMKLFWVKEAINKKMEIFYEENGEYNKEKKYLINEYFRSVR